MKCSFCGSEEAQVIDTRANLEANTPPADIRFASVYRQFETLDDFRDAVQEVKSPRKRRK